MIQAVDSNQGVTPPTSGANQAIDPKVAGDALAKKIAAEMPGALASSSSGTKPTPQSLGQQLATNGTIENDILSLKTLIGQANDLGEDTTQLQSALATAQQNLGILTSQTQDMVNAIFAPAGGGAVVPPSPGAPTLVVPLPNQAQEMTPHEKINAFMLPALATTIFAIMQLVQQQKLVNERDFTVLMVQTMKSYWSFAQKTAAQQVVSGQMQAAGLRAQATAQLVTGILDVVVGFAQMGNLWATRRQVNQWAEQQTKLSTTDKSVHPPTNYEKEQMLGNLLQTNHLGITINMVKSLGTSIANAAGGFAQADAEVQKADADAQYTLDNAVMQMLQQMEQTFQQQIDDAHKADDAVNQMLQGFSQSNTRSMGI